MNRPTRNDAAGRAYLNLQNLARRQGRSTQELLVLYALERFLNRLAASPHAGTFILKGGMLMAALDARRATVDADLLAVRLDNDQAVVLQRVREIASAAPTADDGVTYDADSARARSIREGDQYAGVRITMNAHVARAAVKLQLDINFGDPITPAPVQIAYPSLLDGHPPVQVLGYPLVTVLAEKLATAIGLGDSNTRVRDYADIWTLIRIHDIDAAELRAALEATAAHRQIQLRPLSTVIETLPVSRQSVYAAYRRRNLGDGSSLPEDFVEVTSAVARFADPVLSGPAAGSTTWVAHSATWDSGAENAHPEKP